MTQTNNPLNLHDELALVHPASFDEPSDIPETDPKQKPEIEPEHLPKEDPGQPMPDPDEDDDDDDPFTEREIGDDPDEIQKKTTIF